MSFHFSPKSRFFFHLIKLFKLFNFSTFFFFKNFVCWQFHFFCNFLITPLRQRDPEQRCLSTSVGLSLIDDNEDDDGDRDDDDDVDDVEAERTQVRMITKVLKSGWRWRRRF